MNEQDRQEYITYWGQVVTEVAQDLLDTHDFTAPRLDLALPEEVLIELTLHYNYKAIQWCFSALSTVACIEELNQRMINPDIKILTENERKTLERLQRIANLKSPE